MTRRIARPLSISSLTLAIGVAIGCSLVIGEIPEGSDPASDASSTGGGAGQSGGAGTGGQAGSGQAGQSGAAGASGCLKPPCDCDGDTHEGPQCSGADCDDEDAEVFPGQPEWFSAPSKNNGFDYDCSNGTEKEFETTSCGGISGALACDQQPEGYYDSAVGCGASVGYGKCIYQDLMCKQDVIDAAKVVRCH